MAASVKRKGGGPDVMSVALATAISGGRAAADFAGLMAFFHVG